MSYMLNKTISLNYWKRLLLEFYNKNIKYKILKKLINKLKIKIWSFMYGVHQLNIELN